MVTNGSHDSNFQSLLAVFRWVAATANPRPCAGAGAICHFAGYDWGPCISLGVYCVLLSQDLVKFKRCRLPEIGLPLVIIHFIFGASLKNQPFLVPRKPQYILPQMDNSHLTLIIFPSTIAKPCEISQIKKHLPSVPHS